MGRKSGQEKSPAEASKASPQNQVKTRRQISLTRGPNQLGKL